MKKTKIICTIGPACDSEATLKQMLAAGMNVARFNFSHGSHDEHKKRIDRLKKLRADSGAPLALMLDTKGPEYRIGRFEQGKVTLSPGDTFTFTAADTVGDAGRVSVVDKGIIDELAAGDVILVNDGLVKLEVAAKSGTELNCRVINGGEVSDYKSMSFPGKRFSRPYLSDDDKADLAFGVANDVDFVACSFVSGPEDVIAVGRYLAELGGGDIGIIAKLENRAGVDNAESILDHCDGIMIARGDLGVEIPYEELPAIQKRLIAVAAAKGGITITATEMLESMTTRPRPTRAEISDVANAVFDGTDAVMLSGETAAGRYPGEAVTAMANIVEEAEKSIDYAEQYESRSFHFRDTADAIAHAACQLAIDTDAAAIVATTRTGLTAAMVSRFRPPMAILGLTFREKTYHKLALSWNITPMQAEECHSADELFATAKAATLTAPVPADDRPLVITCGFNADRPAASNLIKIEPRS